MSAVPATCNAYTSTHRRLVSPTALMSSASIYYNTAGDRFVTGEALLENNNKYGQGEDEEHP